MHHPTSPAKMQRMGVREVSLGLMGSYLANRTQVVAAIGENRHLTYSDMMCVNVGVFQGSVLGPLLFLLYTNALSRNNTPMTVLS